MKKYDTIIWDLDGTLADTSEGIFNSIRYTQEKLKLPQISGEQMRSHIGPPVQESYARNFKLQGSGLEKAVQLHKEYATNKGLFEAQLYPNIAEVLTALNKKHFKQAVVTLKFEETAKKMLTYLNIASYFETIIGASANAHSSKGEMLKVCINTINSKNSNVLLIGDSAYDAIGAQEAGIDFLAVTYGFGFSNKKDVELYPHIGYIESTKGILDFLNEENLK